MIKKLLIQIIFTLTAVENRKHVIVNSAPPQPHAVYFYPIGEPDG